MLGNGGQGGCPGPEGQGRERQWEVVFRAPNYSLAGMLREILEGEGLLVFVRSQSGLPQSAFGGPVEVLVPAGHAAAARALVEAFAAPASGERPERRP